MASFSYVGKETTRVDAAEKVSGEARYVGDLHFPNALHVKVLRSTQAHARIVRIDTEAAGSMPGVKLVATGRDMPWLFGDGISDQRALAVDRVRWHGEPVAAVVASDARTAAEAVSRIEVEYEPLPALLDVREAAAPGAELIHPDFDEYHVIDSYTPEPGTNVFHHYRTVSGDPGAAFAACDAVVENEFYFPHIAHVQLEPHCCVARCSPAGRLELWATTQSPFIVRAVLAEAFGLPLHQVTVRNTGYLGGGFGGKSDASIEPLTAALARLLPGRWIRFLLEREEMFFGSLVGRGVWGRYKLGADRNGILKAAGIDVYLAAGGHGWTAVNIVPLAGHNATGPYYIPNLEIDARGVYTNTPPVGAYRGYGHPEGQFMVERQMDLLARELGMDPVLLRLKNVFRDGHVNAIGQKIDCARYGSPAQLIEITTRALDKARREASGSGAGTGGGGRGGTRKKKGWGLAAFMKSPGMAPNAHSTVVIKFNEDGTVNLLSSFTDLGQGAHTAARQMAADIMELPVEKVMVPPVTDTDFSPFEWQTVASRTTWLQSMAISRAWDKALEEIKRTAGKVLGKSPEELSYEKGVVYVTAEPERRLGIERLVHGYTYPDGRTVGGPVIASGSYVPSLSKAGRDGKGDMAGSWTFGCQAAEVEVDLDTGRVECTRFITAVDAGRLVNPALARAQVISAVIHGLSCVLSEETVIGDDGAFRNASLTDYKIFTPQDVENLDIEVHFVETPLPGSRIGCRPIGEHPIVAVAPAVANAVSDAVGVEFFDLPITAQRVLERLDDGERTGGDRRSGDACGDRPEGSGEDCPGRMPRRNGTDDLRGRPGEDGE